MIRKNRKLIGIPGGIALALFLAGIVTAVSCSGGDGNSTPTIVISAENTLKRANRHTYPGDEIQFSVTVDDIAVPASSVKFSVDDATNSRTRFDQNGKLLLSLNELDDNTLTITAELVDGSGKNSVPLKIDRGTFVPSNIQVSSNFTTQDRGTTQQVYVTVAGEPSYLSGRKNEVQWEINGDVTSTQDGTSVIGGIIDIPLTEGANKLAITVTALDATGNPVPTISTKLSEITTGGAQAKNPDWLNIKVGIDHTLAIDRNGDLYTWGRNKYGQLGLGTTNNPEVSTGHVNTPQKVTFDKGTGIRMISGGWGHSMVLRNDRTIHVAGGIYDHRSAQKELINFGSTFKQLGQDSDWVFIHATHSAMYAIKANGQLWAMGYNSNNALGIRGVENNEFVPELRLVDSGDVLFSAVTSYLNHGMAITRPDASGTGGGDLYGWGINDTWQLSDGKDGSLSGNKGSSTPVLIDDTNTWVTVGAGSHYNLYVGGWNAGLVETSRTKGYIEADLLLWGSNHNGRLAINPTTLSRASKEKVLADKNFGRKGLNLQATSHTLVIDNDGKLYSWGNNNYGQLGQTVSGNWVKDDKRLNYTPTEITGVTTKPWAMAIAGGSFSFAIDEDGKMWGWGHNEYGQLGIGNLDGQYTPQPVAKPSN